MKRKNWTAENIANQNEKIILITGASSGIGFEAAKVLSQKGATVIMAVRDNEKCKAAIEKIKNENRQAKVELMQLDLSDINSIRKFSDEFHSNYSRLDILLNNAGVMWPVKREVTKQGFEIQFGVNHLGHFALTGLLLDIIKKTPLSRVVTQSSIAHLYNADINLKDLNWEKNYSKTRAYAQSKLANLLFTYELNRKFVENKIDSIAVASHPGVTNTNLFRYSGFFGRIFNSWLGQDVEIGTLPILMAATEPGLKGSEYFGPTKMAGVSGYPEKIRSSKKSHNIKLAKDLWDVSEKITGVTYNFI